MTLEPINPDGLSRPQTYTQVVVASGSRLVFVAGQVAEDEQGNLVGADDLAMQARRAFANVGRALEAGGARPDQVTKLTIFVVDFRAELPAGDRAGRSAVFGITSRPTRWSGWDAGPSRVPHRGRGGRRRRTADVR